MSDESENQLSTLLNALGVLRTALGIFNQEDKLVYCNEQFRYFFRSFETVDELVGLTYEEILRLILDKGDVSSDEIWCEPEQWIQERLGYHREKFNARTDRLGDGRWIDIKERRTNDGGVIVQWSDATERQRLNIRLENAVECIGDGFGIWDENGRLETFNEKFAERHGMGESMRPGMDYADVLSVLAGSDALKLEETPDEWIGRRLKQRSLPENRELLSYNDGTYIGVIERKGEDESTVVVMSDQTELKTKEAELRFRGQALEKTIYELEMSKSVLEEQGRELVDVAEQLYATRQDLKRSEEALQKINDELEMIVLERTEDLREEIEDHKKTLDELARAKEEAEYANYVKDRFLANLSHELRAPLQSIISYGEKLKREVQRREGDDKIQQYANGISETGYALLGAITDILDLSRIESGGLEFTEVPVNLERTAVSCMRLMQRKADQKGVRLFVDIPLDMPMVQADEHRVTQVFVRLVSNAVKFTNEGGRVTVDGSVDDQGGIVIRVIDTGVGMKPEDIPKALEPFEKVGGGPGHQHDGSGIGLHMAKSLVDMHGGSLTIDSAPGEGTTVAIRFPPERAINA